MLSRSNMHSYQNTAISYAIEGKKTYLALGLGLGKTVSSLTAISDLLDTCSVTKVLIIAPLRVARTVWKQECRNWEHLKHLRVSVVTGSAHERGKALFADADIYVINRENVPWLTEQFKKWPFDMIVIDEASSFKNGSSKRFKCLRKVATKTEYMLLLSGTPAPNSLLDLWSQMYLIDGGERLGKTMSNYKQRFFESDYMGYSFKPREGSHEKIHALIADKMISMSAGDYLDMPDLIVSDERIDIGTKAMSQYREFEKELLLELESGEDIEAVSAAALAGKLLQFANGAVYRDAIWHEVHSAKLDALAELIEDNPAENILLAYNFKHDLERLQARFPDAVVLDKDPETVERWNRKEIKLLMAHPASAGHGLNLQKGGQLCVWFGLNWSLELYQQFNGRLHRQGQKNTVRIVHIVADGTIDQRVLSVLSDKDATQSDLIKSIKAQ